MTIFINPGSGPVEGASLQNACLNMEALAADANASDWIYADRVDEGRYAFAVVDKHGREREVDMPGLPLDRVRYVGEESQNIWDFPRLYVDGSSWVWKYAVDVLMDADA